MNPVTTICRFVAWSLVAIAFVSLIPFAAVLTWLALVAMWR